MKVGVDGLKFPGAATVGALGILREVAGRGLQGVFFRSVLEASPTVDPGELAELRQEADRYGLYLELGLGKVNPFSSAESPAIRAVGAGDTALGCRRLREAAAAVGCREMWVALANKKPAYPGRFAYDRFRTDVSWAEQLAATQRFLGRISPVARDLGIHLNIETHEEITSFEVVAMVQALGPDVAGVVFDTSNVLQRMEDPVAACLRVAPYVRQTHFKDAALVRQPGGIRYQARPCGQGIIDFPAILRILRERQPQVNLTLETRPPADEFVQPGALPTIIEVDDPSFRADHADLGEQEFGDFLALVDRCEAAVRAGLIVDLETADRAPYGRAEAFEAILSGADHLRRALQTSDGAS